MRALIVIAFVVSLMPSPSQSQMVCGPREAVVENLGQKYGETRRGSGLTGSTVIFEIWVSEETRSWTILKTTASGWACVMAAGQAWQDDPRGIDL